MCLAASLLFGSKTMPVQFQQELSHSRIHRRFWLMLPTWSLFVRACQCFLQRRGTWPHTVFQRCQARVVLHFAPHAFDFLCGCAKCRSLGFPPTIVFQKLFSNCGFLRPRLRLPRLRQRMITTTTLAPKKTVWKS